MQYHGENCKYILNPDHPYGQIAGYFIRKSFTDRADETGLCYSILKRPVPVWYGNWENFFSAFPKVPFFNAVNE